jgi:hypothetical protein
MSAYWFRIWLLLVASLTILPASCQIDSKPVNSKTATATLVAPFSISNAQFTSSISLTNHSSKRLTVVVQLLSLLGEDVGHTTLSIDRHAMATISRDSLYSRGREFGTLGPIVVSVEKGCRLCVRGEVTIAARQSSRVNLNEPFQLQSDLSSTTLKTTVLPSLSVPVLAVMNLAPVPQRVSLECTEGGGEHYESDFSLPAKLTFLVNACIKNKSQSHRYDKVLNGDSGPTRKAESIQVMGQIPASLCVWGFAASDGAPAREKHLIGIEFSSK